MISISSDAGIRLAKAKAALDVAKDKPVIHREELNAVIADYCLASDAVASELIAAGFHEYTEQGD